MWGKLQSLLNLPQMMHDLTTGLNSIQNCFQGGKEQFGLKLFYVPKNLIETRVSLSGNSELSVKAC
jgi:hypothetical protein